MPYTKDSSECTTVSVHIIVFSGAVLAMNVCIVSGILVVHFQETLGVYQHSILTCCFQVFLSYLMQSNLSTGIFAIAIKSCINCEKSLPKWMFFLM